MKCGLRLGKDGMEEVIKLIYLGIVLCKQGNLESFLRERAVKYGQVEGVLESYQSY